MRPRQVRVVAQELQEVGRDARTAVGHGGINAPIEPIECEAEANEVGQVAQRLGADAAIGMQQAHRVDDDSGIANQWKK
jgi:hypothetical protein